MAVTPANIAVALGVAAPDAGSVKEQQWAMWIEDAEMLIETRRLEIDETLVIDEIKLDYVVREAVVSHAQNPDNVVQTSISIDDAATQRTYRSSSGTGRVSIRDEWWKLLGLTDRGGRAFEVDTMPPSAGVYGVDYWWGSPDSKTWL